MSFGPVTHEFTRLECVYKGGELSMCGRLVVTILAAHLKALFAVA